MAEAARYLRDQKNADEVAKIGSRFVRGMTADLVKRTTKHVIYDARIGGGTADAFRASVKLLIAQKKMKKPYDPAKYLDTSFIDSTIWPWWAATAWIGTSTSRRKCTSIARRSGTAYY